MKLGVTIILLPAALALPSYHGHGHLHTHGSKAFKSGLPSGAPFQSDSAAGPYGLSNSTLSQAGTSIGNADTVTSTNYLTLYNTIYQSAAPSEAADTGAGGAGGACGGTTTVTYANTVTVTVTGGEAESATAVTPETQIPVTPNQVPETQAPVAPVASSTAPAPKPVAPISESSVPAVEDVATPSATAVSSTAIPEDRAAATSALSATPSPSAAAGSQGKTSPKPPGGKRGLFIPVSGDATQADYVKAFNDNPGKISWIVNQFSGPPGGLSSEFNYVPQCYDKFSDVSYAGQTPHPWTTNAEKALATGNENFFLSFGEPNTPNSQGFTMDAQEGAQEFMTLLQPYATEHGVTIGSPGTLGMPQDYQWQNDFLDECAKLGCKIGWVSGHWFSPCGTASAQDLANTFWGTINTYKEIAQNHSAQYGIDLKVWVDNFSLNCEAATQVEFLNIVVPQMDADPMIERYGYVSITDISQGNGFVNGDGTISDLGLHYATM